MVGRRLVRASIALGCWIAYVGTAAADVPRKPDGSPLPPLSQMSLKTDRFGQPIRVWYAYKGGIPRALPRPLAGEPNPEGDLGRAAEYLEPFYFAMEQSYTVPRPARYLLLVRATEDNGVRQAIGWVDARHVIEGSSALQDPDTQIHRKAMIVNRLVHLREQAGGMNLVRPRLGPERDSEPGGIELQLYKVFFVYAETDDRILIGTRSEFEITDIKDPARIIYGWVPRDRACLWNTRLGFSWEPSGEGKEVRSEPGRAYRNAEDAVERRADDPLMEEKPGRDGKFGSAVLSADRRWPILDWPKGADAPRDRNNQVIPREQRGNEMLRIGAATDLVDAEGVVRLTAEELRMRQDQLNQLSEQVNQIEILFVVDETGSMAPHFKDVGRAIRRILTSTPKGSQTTVRVAVAYYGDTFNGQRAATPAEFTNIIEAGEVIDEGRAIEEIARAVENHRPQIGAAGGREDDIVERIFYGLGQALQGATFERYSRKIVILLGDAGNKSEPGDPTIEELARLLKVPPPNDPESAEGVVPAEFYAIQVVDPDAPHRDPAVPPYFKAFQNEMTQLVNLAKRDRPGSAYAKITRQDDVVAAIDARYRELQSQIADLNQEIEREGVNPTGNHAGPELKRMIREMFGDDWDRDRDKLKGVQLFQEGYVWKFNESGQNQLRIWLLVNDGELARFLELAEGLKKVSGQAGRRNPWDVLADSIDQLVGELSVAENAQPRRPRNWAEAVQRLTGLPVNKSRFLRTRPPAPGPGGARPPGSPFDENDFLLVLKRLQALEDLRNGVRYRWIAKPKDFGGKTITYWEKDTQSREADTRKFHFDLDKRVIWYWIDQEDEWL